MGKIPSQAKRVFQGVIFDVYQWEQELFDGSKDTWEMLKRPDTAEIIPIVGDKILIQEQEQPTAAPFLSLPGGRRNGGEEPLDAAKREFLEETGYTSDDWELLDSVDPFEKAEWTIYWFVARNCKKAHEPRLDAGEKIKIKFVSFDEFLHLGFEERFWGRELQIKLMRLQLDPEKLANFRRKLFG